MHAYIKTCIQLMHTCVYVYVHVYTQHRCISLPSLSLSILLLFYLHLQLCVDGLTVIGISANAVRLIRIMLFKAGLANGKVEGVVFKGIASVCQLRPPPALLQKFNRLS